MAQGDEQVTSSQQVAERDTSQGIRAYFTTERFEEVESNSEEFQLLTGSNGKKLPTMSEGLKSKNCQQDDSPTT